MPGVRNNSAEKSNYFKLTHYQIELIALLD